MSKPKHTPEPCPGCGQDLDWYIATEDSGILTYKHPHIDGSSTPCPGKPK